MRVYFAPLSDSSSRAERLDALTRLISKVGYFEEIKEEGDLVAMENPTWRESEQQLCPLAARASRGLAARVAASTETSVLYNSPRSRSAVSHPRAGAAAWLWPCRIPNRLQSPRPAAWSCPRALSARASTSRPTLPPATGMVVVSHVTGHLAAGMGALPQERQHGAPAFRAKASSSSIQAAS